MKKAYAMLGISVLLAILLLLWWIMPEYRPQGMEMIITLSVLIIIVVFLIEGLKKIQEAKKQLPIEDELSKKAEYKAGYISYLISVYIWVILYFVKDWFQQTGYLLATGILSMSVIFIIARFIYRTKGNL